MEIEDQAIKQLMRSAENFEKAGELENALEYYSRALDILIGRAKDFAQLAGPGVIEAVVGTASISEQYLVKFNEYLKKDKTASAVSNSMGLIFAGMGNKASARVFFEQAIDLTPTAMEYNDPHIGMEMLRNLE